MPRIWMSGMNIPKAMRSRNTVSTRPGSGGSDFHPNFDIRNEGVSSGSVVGGDDASMLTKMKPGHICLQSGPRAMTKYARRGAGISRVS